MIDKNIILWKGRKLDTLTDDELLGIIKAYSLDPSDIEYQKRTREALLASADHVLRRDLERFAAKFEQHEFERQHRWRVYHGLAV